MVTIKQSVFREKKRKQNLRVTRTLPSLFVISPGAKTLNTKCATQVLGEIMEKIEVVICTDPINIHYFLFSWKGSKNKQINNRAMFLYLIQGQMLKFSTLEEKRKYQPIKSLSIVSTKLFNCFKKCLPFCIGAQPWMKRSERACGVGTSV